MCLSWLGKCGAVPLPGIQWPLEGIVVTGKDLRSDFSGLLGHEAYPDAALGTCCTPLVYFYFLH